MFVYPPTNFCCNVCPFSPPHDITASTSRRDQATVTGNATPDSDTVGVSVVDTLVTPSDGLWALYDL